jgi:Sulfatase-modifying factor enzyme 1
LAYQKTILLILGFYTFFWGNSQKFHFIPKQIIKPYEILGGNSSELFSFSNTSKVNNFQMEVDSFIISDQITFAKYNEYLEGIKKDSTYYFYLSQLPDSNITSPENYIKYVSGDKYKIFPVLGITWESAMNFCKWKTLKENHADKINFIYRLPKLTEWLDAYNYLESKKEDNDFNKNFSDWTMNFYAEGYGFNRDSNFIYEWAFYLPNVSSRPRDKRMIAIGDSYLFQREKLIQHFSTYYTFKGYRQIAFRIVKEFINGNEDSKSLSRKVIQYWGLNNKD